MWANSLEVLETWGEDKSYSWDLPPTISPPYVARKQTNKTMNAKIKQSNKQTNKQTNLPPNIMFSGHLFSVHHHHHRYEWYRREQSRKDMDLIQRNEHDSESVISVFFCGCDDDDCEQKAVIGRQ